MSQNLPNVNLPSIEMNGGNQAHLVTSDIKNHQGANQIGVGEYPPKFHKVSKMSSSHEAEPVFQGRAGDRMRITEIVYPFAGDDVHLRQRLLQ